MKLRVAYNNWVLSYPYHSINCSSHWATWFYLYTTIIQSIHTYIYVYIYLSIYIYIYIIVGTSLPPPPFVGGNFRGSEFYHQKGDIIGSCFKKGVSLIFILINTSQCYLSLSDGCVREIFVYLYHVCQYYSCFAGRT